MSYEHDKLSSWTTLLGTYKVTYSMLKVKGKNSTNILITLEFDSITVEENIMAEKLANLINLIPSQNGLLMTCFKYHKISFTGYLVMSGLVNIKLNQGQ